MSRVMDQLVFSVGSELTLFMPGIVEGRTFLRRLGHPAFRVTVQTGKHNQPLGRLPGQGRRRRTPGLRRQNHLCLDLRHTGLPLQRQPALRPGQRQFQPGEKLYRGALRYQSEAPRCTGAITAVWAQAQFPEKGTGTQSLKGLLWKTIVVRPVAAPELVVPIAAHVTAQGNDGVGASLAPEHAREFEPLPDHRLATTFDYAKSP